MKKTLCLAILTSAWMTGCATGSNPIPDSTSMAAILYADKCGACHAVPHPKRNTPTEWEHLMGLMEQRMAEKRMAKLSADEHETLLHYLKSNAR